MAADQGRSLEDSVEREVRAEHRRLEALLHDAHDAFHAGDALDAAREAFGTLRVALDTHFEQEDRLYYPAIWALRPEQKAGLLAAVQEHHDFRARLRAIDAWLVEGELGEARRAFDALAEAFLRHESREEGVLAELDREITALR